jgi:hypothetical protein
MVSQCRKLFRLHCTYVLYLARGKVFVPLSKGHGRPGFPGTRHNSFLPFFYAFNNPNIVIGFYFEYGSKVETASAYPIIGVEMID